MPPVLQNRNREILIDNSPLVSTAVADTYLTADAASGSSSLTVANILGFSTNALLLIEELGGENAEIIKTHASSAPSGTAVTLAANTAKAHSTGARVRVILFDNFELSHATTASGSKTVLTVSGGKPPSALGTGLVAVDPTLLIQRYEDTEYSSGYYFARYKNTIAGTFGSYSDALIYGGWAANTVGYLIDRALARLPGVTLSKSLTSQDCYAIINDCLRLIQGKLKRWPEHYTYNSAIGQTAQGVSVVSIPTDAYDTETNKSVLRLRVGQGSNLTYLDPNLFAAQMDSVAKTQVTTQATAGATSLYIDNSYDFADSGTASVYVSGTKYSITYTGVTRSATAGVLTGIPASGTGSITATVAAGSYVWQNPAEGIPLWWTVRNGQIEFYPLVDAENDNKNILADYSHVATSVDSDGDTIDLQRYDMVLEYVTWKLKMLARNNGELDMSDGYYVAFKERLVDAIRTLPQNNVFPLRPRINRMLKGGAFPPRADIQNLPISDQ